MNLPTVTFVLGCTACGKGTLGLELAERCGGEIVSLDSMKVYRRMDIGTAKPSPEARRRVPHHLIDVVEPHEEFSTARYVQHARPILDDLQARGKPAFVVGGTVLYFKALTEGLFAGPGADTAIRDRLHAEAEAEGTAALHERLQNIDPQAADRIHPNDLKRIVRALEVFELTGRPISELQTQWKTPPSRSAEPQALARAMLQQQKLRTDAEPSRDREGAVGRSIAPVSLTDSFVLGLRREREDQNRRINARVRRLMDAGFLNEVQALLSESGPLSHTARKALGYAEMIAHLEGRMPLADAVERIKINSRRFAKAQRTWLRRIPGIHWIDLAPDAEPAQVAEIAVRSWQAKITRR